jgi:putative aldouronate transport system permease protein
MRIRSEQVGDRLRPIPVPAATPDLRLGPRARSLARRMWRHRWVYLIAAPALAWFLVFKYVPLYNAQIAFRDFRPLLGIEGSPWVGLRHFETFVSSFYFGELITNTVLFSMGRLVLGLPAAIVLAIALYETRYALLRRLVQTSSYMPHFLSWVIMFGILLAMLSPGSGAINDVIRIFGGQPIAFLTSPDWFRWVVILSEIWKETGWSTIIYLAALLAIDPQLYEAAAVDGASRLQRIRYISIPGIMPVIVLVTLLRLGQILDGNFQQIFVLYSLPVYSVGDILDTWVYRQGILEFQFGLATAVGLFNGVIGLILIVTANRLAMRIARQGLY